MEFSKIRPFVRYVHYLPLDKHSEYSDTIPYDNRLFFACCGSGEIEADGNTYIMEKGSLLIIPSGTKYRLKAPKNTTCYIGLNFDYTSKNSDNRLPIPPAQAAAYDPLMRLEQIVFRDLDLFNGIVYSSDGFFANGILMKIYREYTQKTIYSDGMLSSLTHELLIECARRMRSQNENGSRETVNQIIDYIRENYGKPLTNRTIGKRFGLHENYIGTLFRSFTGMTLHHYLLETRISFSLEMLARHEYSIGEIADRCGFSSVYHFSKTFKNIIGVPPSKYN